MWDNGRLIAGVGIRLLQILNIDFKFDPVTGQCNDIFLQITVLKYVLVLLFM